MGRRRISPEEYYDRYIERFPDNRFNMSPKNFEQPLLLQVFECAVHGTLFQIAPYYLVRPTKRLCGCEECGKEVMSQVSSETMSKQWEDPEFREMISQAMSERWQYPEFREMMGEVQARNNANIGPSKGVLHIAEILNNWDIEYQGGGNMANEFIIPGTAYRFDFYLPDYDTFIEFHGRQHYEWVQHFHGTHEEFLYWQSVDQWKADWAYENSYGLLVIPCTDIEYAESLIAEYLGLY